MENEQDGNDCRRVYETSCITTKSIKATSKEVKATEKVGGGRLLICTWEVEPMGEGTYHKHQTSANSTILDS